VVLGLAGKASLGVPVVSTMNKPRAGHALACAAVAITLLCGAAGASAQTTVGDMLAKPHPSLTGVDDDFAGQETRPAGDVNGDGRPDLLVGGNSKAWIVFGPVSGNDVPLAAPSQGGFLIDATAIWGFYGISAAPAGDVNGDGKADVIVGVRAASNNSRTGSGSAFVVFGSESPAPVVLPDLGSRGFRIDGASAGDQLGMSVDGAGDVNGDGLDDVVVGTEGTGNQRTGRSAYVVFGRNSTATVAVNSATLGDRGFRIDGDRLEEPGVAVAGVGDVNGDRLDDVLIGAPWADNNGRVNSGSAYLVFGHSSRSTVTLSSLGGGGLRIDGAGSDYLGSAVAGAGDVNGDGRPDLLLGAPAAPIGSTTGGTAYVVFGSSATGTLDLSSLGSRGLTITSGQPPDDFGRSVAAAGDLNGDGLDDVVVGASTASWDNRPNSGAAYLIPGRGSGGAVNAAALGAAGRLVTGALADDRLGTGVGGGQDLTGDGRPDLLVGAPRADIGGARNPGSVHVLGDLSSVSANALDAAPGGHVTLDATFFGSGESLSATLNGTDLGHGSTDAAGHASLTVTIPQLAPGAAPIQVTGQASGAQAGTPFTVRAPMPISLSPTSALPGAMVSVASTGYRPGEATTLLFDNSPVGWVPADSTGRVMTTSLTVPATAPAGDHRITVLGELSGYSEAATIRVTPPIWAQFGFSSAHTGANPYETLLSPTTVAGLVRGCTGTLPASAGTAAPAVAGSQAIAPTLDGSVRSVRTNGCGTQWSASVGSGAATSATLANGVVFAGSADRGLTALSEATGRELWRSTAHGGTSASPVSASGRIYAGFHDGTLASVDPATGADRWSRSLGAAVDTPPAVGSGKVFATTADGGVISVDAGTGAAAWSIQLPAASASPVLAAGRILLAGIDGRLRSVVGSNGAADWTASFSDGTGAAPAVSGEVVIAGTSSGLEAVDLRSGRHLWSAALAHSVQAPPVVANGVAYAVAADTLVAVSVATGEQLFSASLGAVGSSPVVLGGRVYVATAGSRLLTFGL
jgi:outer membrane protein assembly factor BamB